MEARFGSLPGVVRTRVGYTGGKKASPTYRSLGGHTEAVQIDYDPSRVSYEALLDVFWRNHNPARKPTTKQYMSAVFYHNEEQKKLAFKTRDRWAETINRKIHTPLLAASEFFLAEAYHQKYRLKQETILMREFSHMYPNHNDLNNSTAAARVNGFLSGYGTLKQLYMEIDHFGLSPEGRRQLLDVVGTSRARRQSG